MGKDYWAGLIAWLKDSVAKRGMINPADVDLFHVVDTAEEAVQIVADHADSVHAAALESFSDSDEEPVEG